MDENALKRLKGRLPSLNTLFKIKGEHIELIKLLKATGLCSTGGIAKIVTAEGRVTVDGKVERRKRKKIHKGQVVAMGGEVIEVA